MVRDAVTGVLAGVVPWAWLVATSARWSWALAVRDALPAEAMFLTWLRGPAPVVRGLVALVAVPLTIALAVLVARRAGAVAGVAAGVLVTPVVLHVALLAIAPPSYGTRTTFDVMRPGLEQAVAAMPDDAEKAGYGGTPLAPEHRALTTSGKAEAWDGGVFFPQWTRIIDDAGGYFYSPRASPEGRDMHGMICEAPLRLDDAWWACGMPPEPAPS
ncbi:hypothetical protein Q760_00475 [Cellulomonas cellasea DSM 20118]|uniref:Uncharacterized protein n=1 Tax=Cellulomonas cellasea DSM 20118 TaxID=1408250 RepID=A0A0A0BBT5_9CELL|nr:hypothetical protein Q760_00475 [Cellulomonas cellasea DSM 20118]